MNMRETIQQWINERDLPELLRTISALCSEKYERDSRALYEKYYKDCQRRSLMDEGSPEERRDRDINRAFLGISLKYNADYFEQLIRQAGMTNAELDALYRKEEIERLERELEQKRKIS